MFALVKLMPDSEHVLEMILGGLSQDRARSALLHWRANGKDSPARYQIRQTGNCENCGAPYAVLEGNGFNEDMAYLCIDVVACDSRLDF